MPPRRVHRGDAGDAVTVKKKRDSIYRFDPKGPIYDTVSCTGRVRQWVFRHIAGQVWFDQFASAMVVINFIGLAVDSKPFIDNPGFVKFQTVFEKVFVVLFALEVAIRLIGLTAFTKKTFRHPGGFFRSGWFCLDFFIVAVGLVYLALPDVDNNLSSLRLLRLLRPLRTLRTRPGLQAMVKTLFRSFQGMLNVLILLSFIFIVFSILCHQLWSGVLRQHCVLDPGVFHSSANMSDVFHSSANMSATNISSLLSPFGNSSGLSTTVGVVDESVENQLCAIEHEGVCGFGYNCLPTDNDQVAHFDNIGNSLLTIIVISSLSGWSDIMYDIMTAWGGIHNSQSTMTAVASVFILLIMFTSYFVVCLVLAVVFESFDKATRERKLLQQRDRQVKSALKMQNKSMSSRDLQEQVRKMTKEKEREKKIQDVDLILLHARMAGTLPLEDCELIQASVRKGQVSSV
jgi:hypothetical protein